MIKSLKKILLWPFGLFRRKDFSTLKRLLNSPEINPNKRKRAYSESETIKYLTRKVSLLERNLKRIESKTDSVRDRFDNFLHTQEKTNETENAAEEITEHTAQ